MSDGSTKGIFILFPRIFFSPKDFNWQQRKAVHSVIHSLFTPRGYIEHFYSSIVIHSKAHIAQSQGKKNSLFTEGAFSIPNHLSKTVQTQEKHKAAALRCYQIDVFIQTW